MGHAKLICHEAHRKYVKFDHQRRAYHRGTATVRVIRSLDGDTIRKDRLCKGHHRTIGDRRIRIGGHLRTRVDMFAVGVNHYNMCFFEVITVLM